MFVCPAVLYLTHAGIQPDTGIKLSHTWISFCYGAAAADRALLVKSGSMICSLVLRQSRNR